MEESTGSSGARVRTSGIMESKTTNEDDLSTGVNAFAKKVAALVSQHLLKDLRFLLVRDGSGETPGVRVRSVSDVARSLGKTTRQLRGLESKGILARRRRISGRRVGYLAHEVDGLAAEAVRVRDLRRLSLEDLAEKLGLHPKTVLRMTEDLPPRIDGLHWDERDIDDWLLSRPQV